MNARKNKRKRAVFLALALLLTGILVYSLLQFLDDWRHYEQEAEARSALLPYKPAKPADSLSPADPALPSETASENGGSAAAETASGTPGVTDPEPAVFNSAITRLKADHPNAVGWISVPGTQVDYPFVQGKDNDYFLHRDVDGNDLYAGIPFLDYRCAGDLSGVNTVFYAHNMRNGSMFGELDNFRYKPFFDENRDIYIFLEDRTVHAEIVACLVVDPNEKEYLYDLQPKADHLPKLLADARCAKRIAPSPEQRFITLSTCGFEFDDARILIVGVIDSE